MEIDDTGSYLPGFFEPLLAEQYEPADVERILAGCCGRRAVSLRANTLKTTREDVAHALDSAGIVHESVPWYADAFVLPDARERDVWALPIYERGEIYLQSLSSMIPALVLGAKAGEDVCDLCAAPGGKTTQIAALSGGAYVTACEMHAPRAEKLEYNLAKLGVRNATVMRCDARQLDDFFSFDRILLDAPCSGSGTLDASNPKTARRFTTKLIEKSVKSQRALFAKALSLLRPGGTLVYSTCSVIERENEDIVRWALEHAPRGKTFEMKPIALGDRDTARSADNDPDARADAGEGARAGVDVGAGPDVGPDVGAGGNPNDLPVLPTSLEETLSLCPTSRYEGFFVAKIARTR